LLEDFKDRKNAEGMLKQPMQWLLDWSHLKPNLQFEDFTWEAQGIRAGISLLRSKQTDKGTFENISGQQGVVYFRVPFDSPPNVELSGPSGPCVVITECTAKNFKWKNVPRTGQINEGPVQWVAQGIKAAEPKAISTKKG
jgi:hypothetical protein